MTNGGGHYCLFNCKAGPVSRLLSMFKLRLSFVIGLSDYKEQETSHKCTPTTEESEDRFLELGNFRGNLWICSFCFYCKIFRSSSGWHEPTKWLKSTDYGKKSGNVIIMSFILKIKKKIYSRYEKWFLFPVDFLFPSIDTKNKNISQFLP